MGKLSGTNVNVLFAFFGGVGVEAACNTTEAELPTEKFDNDTNFDKYTKHLLSSKQRSLSEKEIARLTSQSNPAKYFDEVNAVRSLEAEALENGKLVSDSNYIIYDAKKIIGASDGELTPYIRLDLSPIVDKDTIVGGNYHGHPITKAEYEKLFNK